MNCQKDLFLCSFCIISFSKYGERKRKKEQSNSFLAPPLCPALFSSMKTQGHSSRLSNGVEKLARPQPYREKYGG